MSTKLTHWTDDALGIVDTLASRATNLVHPSIRLGVTGLSRAGKTVFISSLVHNLVHGGRLPLFEASREGRITKVHLDPQPDDAVPRFQVEDHIRDLVRKRIWPDSTRAVSELRLTIHYRSASAFSRMLAPGKLSIDLIDYPGEWLMDLPLLGMDYREFSDSVVAMAMKGRRATLSADYLTFARSIDPLLPANEEVVRQLAERFTAYLRACKADENSFSALAPGRFLMPGDLEGSPALTFAPLPGLTDAAAPRGSLLAMMQRRYESYKSVVVRPFFRDHFARLDRQIVLVDALSAINRGPEAVADLETAMADVLSCFKAGAPSFLASLVSRRIDKVLVAATKADHLHHEGHERLDRLTRRLVERAIERAGQSGASIDVLALASVRATREATVTDKGQTLPVIVGTPMAGESINGERFDGKTKTAIFPGDLPANPESFFKALESTPEASVKNIPELTVVRFRPPEIDDRPGELDIALPHIRLDRALEFLLGDRLR